MSNIQKFIKNEMYTQSTNNNITLLSRKMSHCSVVMYNAFPMDQKR